MRQTVCMRVGTREIFNGRLFTAIYVVTEFQHSFFIIQNIRERGLFTLNDLDIWSQNPSKYFERIQFLVTLRMLNNKQIFVEGMFFYYFAHLNRKTFRKLC
jgi:hypothetical protein